MPDIKQHDPAYFPLFTGLDKPALPGRAPVRKISLPLPGQPTRKNVVSASPLHGVTRLSLVVGGRVSETYNNGKGDSNKRGQYFTPVTEVLAFNPTIDKPKICWKVRNTDGFIGVKFELFRQGNNTAIWSLSWDKVQIQTKLLQGGLDAGSKVKDGQTIPIHWSGSLDWSEVVLDKGMFPDGRLTIEQSPYQLRMTVNQNEPGTDKMGYPLIAWTYFSVGASGGTAVSPLTPAQLADSLKLAASSKIPFLEGFETVFTTPLDLSGG
jgi:hypothetical protein